MDNLFEAADSGDTNIYIRAATNDYFDNRLI